MAQNSVEQIERALVYERVRKAYARVRAQATGGWVLNEGPVEVMACPFIDLFNGLMSPNWPEESAALLWRRALILYKQTGQGMFVSFGPSSSPLSLSDRVVKDGFRGSSSVPFMHLDLADLKTHPPSAGVRVERIPYFSFFEKHEHPWLGPVGAPYRQRKLQFMRQCGEGPAPRLWQFVALHQRRIVGAATVFAHGDEIAFFDVVVRKFYRQRGIGTQLMVEACAFARGLGMRAAGLGASGAGLGLYEKVGFSHAGCYSDYFLSPSGVAAMDDQIRT